MMQTEHSIPIVDAYPIYNNTSPVSDAIPLNPINNSLNKNKNIFIKNTFAVLLLQLSVTFTGCFLTINNKPDIIEFLNHHTGFTFVPIIFMPFSLIFLMCCSKNKTVKYIMFSIFTLSTTGVLAIVTIRYDTYIILQAITSTCVISGGISVYAYVCAKKGISFDEWQPYLFMLLIALIMSGIFQLFIVSTILNTIIGFLGTIVFSGYLLYDVNQLYLNDDKYTDDPVISAINIYLDIINIFIYIIQCLECGNQD